MVNHNNIFKKIGYILNELQDQYQFLSENPEQLSELELELFLANANFLADHVQIVKKLTINKPVKELPEASEDVEPAKFSFKEPLTPPAFPNAQNEEKEVVKDPEYKDQTPSFEFVLNDRSPAETIDLEEVIEDNHHEEQVDYNEQEAEDIEEYDNEVTYVEPSIDVVGPEPFLVYNEIEPVNYEEEVASAVEAPQTQVEKVSENPVVFQAPPVEPTTPLAAPAAPAIEQVAAPIQQQEPVAQKPLLIADDLKAKEVPAPTARLSEDKVEGKVVQPEAHAPRLTLNEILAAGQKSTSFNQDTSSPAITDLKKAVNLNEKLLYIKDLFNGYNLAYSEAIDIINKLPDFRTADSFLQNNYAVKNNWQSKQSTVDKFYALLKQRFPAD